jgi:hypothetical protein
VLTQYRQPQPNATKNSRLFEIACLLVRLNHVARFVEHANHGIM